MKFLKALFNRGEKKSHAVKPAGTTEDHEKPKSWNNGDPSSWRATFLCGEDPSTFLPPHRQSHYEIKYCTTNLADYTISLNDAESVSSFMAAASKGHIGYATISPSNRIYLGE